jgi:hypothetical protein
MFVVKKSKEVRFLMIKSRAISKKLRKIGLKDMKLKGLKLIGDQI